MLTGYVITDGTHCVDGVRSDGEVVWISESTQQHRDVWNSWDAAHDFITRYHIEGVRIKRVYGDENKWYL